VSLMSNRSGKFRFLENGKCSFEQVRKCELWSGKKVRYWEEEDGGGIDGVNIAAKRYKHSIKPQRTHIHIRTNTIMNTDLNLNSHNSRLNQILFVLIDALSVRRKDTTAKHHPLGLALVFLVQRRTTDVPHHHVLQLRQHLNPFNRRTLHLIFRSLYRPSLCFFLRNKHINSGEMCQMTSLYLPALYQRFFLIIYNSTIK
jgi:hypothetical protein